MSKKTGLACLISSDKFVSFKYGFKNERIKGNLQ